MAVLIYVDYDCLVCLIVLFSGFLLHDIIAVS